MQRVRVTLLIVLLAAVMAATGTTSAFASPKGSAQTTGNVTGQRPEAAGLVELKFNAGGTPSKADGQFTYQESRQATLGHRC
jgi:hypothetical protein